MYVKPGYTPIDSRPQATAPTENGERLATLERNKGNEELRVTLGEYNGYPFVGLRVWSRGQDGSWWPVKGKGLSIKVGELTDVAAALTEAASRLAGGHVAGNGRETRPANRTNAPGASRGGSRPSPGGWHDRIGSYEPGPATGVPFDEFDEGN